MWRVVRCAMRCAVCGVYKDALTVVGLKSRARHVRPDKADGMLSPDVAGVRVRVSKGEVACAAA